MSAKERTAIKRSSPSGSVMRFLLAHGLSYYIRLGESRYYSASCFTIDCLFTSRLGSVAAQARGHGTTSVCGPSVCATRGFRPWSPPASNSPPTCAITATGRASRQEALADICDLHRTEISLLERCKRSPRLETIVILASGLGSTSPGELLEGIKVALSAAGRPGDGRATVPAAAQLAQLVEHFHGKEGVSGSSPELGSQTRITRVAPSTPRGWVPEAAAAGSHRPPRASARRRRPRRTSARGASGRRGSPGRP